MGWAIETKGEYPADWPEIATRVKAEAGGRCIRCTRAHNPSAGYCLTVHHWDGDKANCRWWNLMALCQRCHLSIQGRVNPAQPFMFEHSTWMKPYAAGFYARKYWGMGLDRAAAEAVMDDLLAMERMA